MFKFRREVFIHVVLSFVLRMIVMYLSMVSKLCIEIYIVQVNLLAFSIHGAQNDSTFFFQGCLCCFLKNDSKFFFQVYFFLIQVNLRSIQAIEDGLLSSWRHLVPGYATSLSHCFYSCIH